MKKIIIILFIMAFAVSCTGNKTSAESSSSADKIRVAYLADFAGTSAAAIAQEKGFFKEENLDVELVKFLNGPSEIAAMLSKDIQFAYIGHGAHSLAIQGKVNVLIPNGLGKSEQIIVGKWANINDIAGLKGKTVGTQLGTSGDIVLDIALRKAGITKSDVNVVNMDVSGIVSSMVGKKVDAVSVWAPYTFEISKQLGDEVIIIASITNYLDEAVFPSSWIVTPEYQKDNPDINVFTGLAFPDEDSKTFDYSQLSDEQRAQLAMLSTEELAEIMETYSNNANASYDGNLELLGAVDLNKPSSISIYPKDFDAKDVITQEIDNYNQKQRDDGKEENVINYTDLIGIMMSSVSQIIDTISYVLIAFVAISLVVSSIMIGIITYISVLERTKEIGILRAIGASKKDISRVFNAETFIVGLIAGLLGIGVTVLLNIPITNIIYAVTGVSVTVSLPAVGGIILVLISMILTIIAGLIPAKMASKKDPVEALRTE